MQGTIRSIKELKSDKYEFIAELDLEGTKVLCKDPAIMAFKGKSGTWKVSGQKYKWLELTPEDSKKLAPQTPPENAKNQPAPAAGKPAITARDEMFADKQLQAAIERKAQGDLASVTGVVKSYLEAKLDVPENPAEITVIATRLGDLLAETYIAFDRKMSVYRKLNEAIEEADKMFNTVEDEGVPF